jgi:hypothetical protein
MTLAGFISFPSSTTNAVATTSFVSSSTWGLLVVLSFGEVGLLLLGGGLLSLGGIELLLPLGGGGLDVVGGDCGDNGRCGPVVQLSVHEVFPPPPPTVLLLTLLMSILYCGGDGLLIQPIFRPLMLAYIQVDSADSLDSLPDMDYDSRSN